jgi:diadenylate cyclase
MLENLANSLKIVYEDNILTYLNSLYVYPIKLITLVIDVAIVIFLAYKAFKMLKNTRAWQLLKGIIVLVIVTVISKFLNLYILNYILSSVMTYGVFLLIVVFQPELRRALEQIGSSNRFNRLFGIDDDLEAKKKENIYRIAIAATELSKAKTGALMVIERDIKIQDIISTGIPMNAEISPQLLVNIFVPNTPLHDGAVIISDNKIAAASCMLPLADDKDIARELGTRHRAAIGISKESDAIVVVVSEETGKMSIAKDGTLIADVREDVLKKILIKNLVNESKPKQNTKSKDEKNSKDEKKQEDKKAEEKK